MVPRQGQSPRMSERLRGLSVTGPFYLSVGEHLDCRLQTGGTANSQERERSCPDQNVLTRRMTDSGKRFKDRIHFRSTQVMEQHSNHLPRQHVE